MDDRTKSMITVLLIIVGAGVLLERSNLLSDLARGGRINPLLQADAAIVLPTGATSIDVLSNDVGLEDGAADRLIIVQRPACGTAFVGDGEVQYIPAKHCTGSQTFRYGFFGGNPSETGLVRAMIRYDDVPQNYVPAQNEIAAALDQEIGHAALAAPSEMERQSPSVPSSLGSFHPDAASSSVVRPIAPTRPGRPMRVDLVAPAAEGVSGGGSSSPDLSEADSSAAPMIGALGNSLVNQSSLAAGSAPARPGGQRFFAPIVASQPTPAARFFAPIVANQPTNAPRT